MGFLNSVVFELRPGLNQLIVGLLSEILLEYCKNLTKLLGICGQMGHLLLCFYCCQFIYMGFEIVARR